MKIKKDREKGFETILIKLSGHITGDRLFFVKINLVQAIRMTVQQDKVVGGKKNN